MFRRIPGFKNPSTATYARSTNAPATAFRAVSLAGDAGVSGGASRWRALRFAAGLSCLLVGFGSPVLAGGQGAFLVPQKAIHAPSGFVGLCSRYSWVCKATGTTRMSASDKLHLAAKINRAVNRQVRQIEDRQQYGKEEYWALPTRRGGDCEDLVLLKKKMLIERGVPSQSLLISTVLDRQFNSHAVLVLRTAQGDMVLDNLTNKILPWNRTGYTFLKLQNPKALSRWDAVLAGSAIDDRPTASR